MIEVSDTTKIKIQTCAFLIKPFLDIFIILNFNFVIDRSIDSDLTVFAFLNGQK